MSPTRPNHGFTTKTMPTLLADSELQELRNKKMDQPFIEGGCFRNTNPKVLRDNNMRILVDIEQCSKTRSNSLAKICSS